MSSPKNASKKPPLPLAERQSFGEISSVGKGRATFKRLENQRALTASSVNHCSMPEKVGEDRIPDGQDYPPVSESENLSCESVKGVVTLRLGGGDNSSGFGATNSHNFMPLMQCETNTHTSPLISSHDQLSSPNDRCSYETVTPVSQTCKGALLQEQQNRVPTVALSSPASSLLNFKTTCPHVQSSAVIHDGKKEVSSLTPILSTPSHSTPKSVVSSGSSKILAGRITNGAHRQPTTPSRHSNGWTR